MLSAQPSWRTVYSFGAGSSTPGSDAFEIGGRIYFNGNTSASGNEAWASDGSIVGTQQLIDLYPGSISSFPRAYTEFNGEVIFYGNSSTYGWEMFKTDGTPAGTGLKMDLNPGSGAGITTTIGNPWIVMGSNLIMRADLGGGLDTELYLSDGTTAGTALIKEINTSGSCACSNFTKVGSWVIFSATDGTNGIELYRTDGTNPGTGMILDINSIGDSDPVNFYPFGTNKMLFSADDGANGRELWVTDGTPGGTMMVKNINPGGDSYPTNFFTFGGKVYFIADDGTNGIEMWVTDGTPAGTMLFKDIDPAGDGMGYFTSRIIASNFIEFNGKFYFIADDGTNGYELWESDGTPGNTQMVVDLNPGGDGASVVYDIVEVGGFLWYQGSDGSSGIEVVYSNGTPAGTGAVDLISGATATIPRAFVGLGNEVFVLGRSSADLIWRMYAIDASTLPFPVEWLDFEAALNPDQSVSLQWQTASEKNNHYFTVEHSLDGEPFEEIGQVLGVGNSDDVQSYRYLHHQPEPGQHQYRIRQTDLDGQSSHSSILALSIGQENVPRWSTIDPGSRYEIQLPRAEYPYHFSIIDGQGRVVQTGQTEGTSYVLDISFLAKGVYTLECHGPSQTWTHRVIR